MCAKFCSIAPSFVIGASNCVFWQFRTFEKLVTKTPKNNPVCASPEKGALKQLRGFFKARETETLHPLWPQ